MGMRRVLLPGSKVTNGEKYGPAMEMQSAEDAALYLEELVQHSMSHGYSRQEAIAIEKSNLGYYAGYYSQETRERVERLFSCSHPVFGSAKFGVDTAEKAYERGRRKPRS